MKIKSRRLLVFFVIFAFLSTMLFPICASAEGTGAVSLSSATGAPGSKVQLTLSFSADGDILYLDSFVLYNASVLSLDKIDAGDLDTSCSNINNKTGLAEVFILKDDTWSNSISDGSKVEVTLDFSIKSTAPIGTYDITFDDNSDLCDMDSNSYSVNYTDGSIIVSDGSAATAATPSIDSQPVGGTYILNASPTPITTAASKTDTGTLSYQWYMNSLNYNSGGTAIVGATGTSYTPSTAVVGTAYYYCVVTNTLGASTAKAASNTAAIIVNFLAGTTVYSGTIASSQTWNDGGAITPAGVTVTGSADAQNPVVITIHGTVKAYGPVTVASGYVLFTGGGTLRRASNEKYDGSLAGGYLVKVVTSNGLAAATLTLDGITLDGTNSDGTIGGDCLLWLYGYSGSATAIMKGNTVIQNTNNVTALYTYAGGVQIGSNASFYLESGTIQNCTGYSGNYNANHDQADAINLVDSSDAHLYIMGGKITYPVQAIEASKNSVFINPTSNISMTTDNTSGALFHMVGVDKLSVSAPDGYFIDSCMVNGAPVTSNADETYTIDAKTTKNLNISVTPPVGTYTSGNLTVNYAAGYGGAVSISGGAFTVIAKNTAGYAYGIDTISVDGKELTAADVTNLTQPSGSGNTALPGASGCTYTFPGTMTGAHSLNVTFAYTLYLPAVAHGTLSVSRGSEKLTSGSIVRSGDILTITATPATDSYYVLDTLTVTGLTKNTDGTYTVTAAQGDKTPAIAATFSVAGYYVTVDDAWANFTSGGTALNSQAGAKINNGGSLALTITPVTGYTLDQVSATNGTLTKNGGSAFTLSGVTANTKLTATVTAIDDGAAAADLTISDKQGLISFANAVNGGNDYSGKLVRLSADIDLGGADWTAIGQPTATHFEPHPFRGVFDGQGHTISGLHYVRGENNASCELYGAGSRLVYLIGLFGCVDGAVIRNVIVRGSVDYDDTYSSGTDIGNSALAGGIAALDLGGSTLMNCASFVPMELANADAGGILGTGEETTSVIGCMNYGSLTEHPYEHGHNGGNIVWDPMDGDIFGITAFAGRIYNCGNTGDLKLATTTTLIGVNEAAGITGGSPINAYGNDYPIRVEGCFNAGNADAGYGSHAAGIVAVCSKALIENCYNTGDIATKHDGDKGSPAYASGILGENKGKRGNGNTSDGEVLIQNCYNIGSVTATGAAAGFNYLGEIVPPECFYPSFTVPNMGGDKQYFGGTKTNCYTGKDTFNASSLSGSFKEDSNAINSGRPLLTWQSDTVPDTAYSITVKTNVKNAAVKVYSDAARSKEIKAVRGIYSLKNGQYYFTVSANGYVTVNSGFKVAYFDKTVTVTLNAAANVTFKVTPADASFTLTDSSKDAVTPASSVGGVYRFRLCAGSTYTYTATADGYNGTTREYTAVDGGSVSVILTKSGQSGDNKSIKGGETISKGGVYNIERIDAVSQGIITINTTEPVTLVGTGTSVADAYKNLYLDCTSAGVNLTIQNLYISNELGSTNLIDFMGAGNQLYFSGVNILDMNTGATGYAMIHVKTGTSLTLGGVTPYDTLYFYKREQGAGIGGNGGATGGGQSPEYNGSITITGGNLFMKNSKQGALIGSGAQASAASGSPGNIVIQGGVLNLIAISRGAAIGGSAGSTGGSTGTNVYIYPDACVNINVDYSGSAIGGGGYAEGNDSDGGILHYYGGSIRTFIDKNAVDCKLWKDVTAAGVNEVAITADKVNGAGKKIYLVALNTTKLASRAGSFTVLDGSSRLYSGGLHGYSYINETHYKTDEIEITYTIDNWTPLSDPNLYLYLTGENHTLTVNEETVKAVWDSAAKTFKLTYPSGSGTTPASSEIDVTATTSGTISTASVSASDVTKAISEAVANAAKDSSQPTIAINVDAPGSSKTVQATIPASSITDIAKSTVQSLTVTTPVGSVTLDAKTLDSVSGQAKGADVTLSVAKVDNETLTAAQQKAVGDGLVVDLSITSGGTAIHDFSGGSATVSVPYTLKDGQDPNNIAVWYITEDGTLTQVQGAAYDSETGRVTFTTTHLSSYVIKYSDAENWTNPFKDIAKTAWYYDDVKYVVTKKLFNGTTDTTFAPDTPMTRAMFVTVLGRLAGIKVSEYTTNSFTDVKTGQWYSAYVEWAAKNGIVTGVGDKLFNPEGQITRQEMAVILYRYAQFAKADVSGSKDPSGFPDWSKTSSWAIDAMKWAVSKGLVNGMGDGTLSPQGTASRAQVAAIIHRFAIL